MVLFIEFIWLFIKKVNKYYKMVKSCCICKIESGTISDISIHNIPKNNELKRKWFRKIGREVSKSSAVCSQHFESKDFYFKEIEGVVKRFLLPEAVPSLLLTQSASKSTLASATDDDHHCHSDSLLLTPTTITATPTTSIQSTSELDRDCRTSLADTTECISMQTTVQTDCNINYSSIEEENVSYPHIINNENSTNCELNQQTQCDKMVSKCTLSTKVSLKRKSEEIEKSKKRFCIPRFIGDLRRDDFKTEDSWRIVQQHVEECRKKQKLFNQQLNRCKSKVKNFKSLLEHLKKNGLLTNKDCNVLDVSDIEMIQK